MAVNERAQYLKRKSLRHAMFFIFIAVIVLIYFVKNKKHSATETTDVNNTPEVIDSSIPMDKKPNPEDMNQMGVGALEATEPSEYFEKSLTECISLNTFNPLRSSSELIQYLQSLNPTKSIQIENYHFKLPNGDERRVHLIPTENGDKGVGRELRLFKLDSDGMPERIEAGSQLEKNPTNEEVQGLLSQGKVFYHQTKEVWTFPDDMNLNVEFQNNKVFEFQLQVQTQTFSCRLNDCECTGI